MNKEQEEGGFFDINSKISDEVKDYGYRQLSVQVCKLKGSFSFEKAKAFVLKNLLSSSQDSQGFARNYTMSNSEFVCTYCREGKKTHRFASSDSEIIPKTIQHIKDLSTIRFCKRGDGSTHVQIYGGSEKFVDLIMERIIPKMANFSDCHISTSKIKQAFIRKLCLVCHRGDVEQIKIDPSKSKNYARIIKEEEEQRTSSVRYEFIIKENLFKGEHILNSRIMARLFEEEPDIEILQFKSKIPITRINKNKITYEIKTSGKFTFYVNKDFFQEFNDEFEATENLLSNIELDAKEQILLEDALMNKKGNSSLDVFSKEGRAKIIEGIASHIAGDEYGAANSLIIQLHENKNQLNSDEQKRILAIYLELISKDPHRAFEFGTHVFSIMPDLILESERASIESRIKELDTTTKMELLKFLDETNSPVVRGIMIKILTEKVIGKSDLKELWNEVKKEQSNDSKGKKLENFLAHLFSNLNGMEIDQLRKKTSNEEIDITLKNRVDDSFWTQLNSPMIFVEAKNWTKKVGTAEVSVFRTKLNDHGNLCKVGFFVAVNGFTKGSDFSQARSAKEDKTLTLVTGQDIDEFLENELSIRDFLEKMITKSLR